MEEHYSLDTLADVLLNDSVPHSRICSKQPVHVCRNVTFVVDLEKLEDPTDVRADENGVWIRKGSPVVYVSKYTKEGKAKFFRWTKKPTHAHQFNITRTYYRHASSPDFTRMIVVAYGEYKQKFKIDGLLGNCHILLHGFVICNCVVTLCLLLLFFLQISRGL